MQLRTFRIPLFFLISGLGWAMISDPLITTLATDMSFRTQDSIRGLNDLIFVTVSSVFLYLQIRKEQKKLRLSEEQYRTLFMANPNPMWIYHIESRKFIEVNQAAINKYGYTHAEFLKMKITDIRPQGDPGKLEDDIRIGETTLSDGFLWEHITKCGEHIIVSVTSHHLTFNNLLCRMVMVTDVTEVIQNKEKLEDSLKKQKVLNEQLRVSMQLTQRAHAEGRRMAEVIDKIKNLVIMMNKDGKVIWVNHAFSEYTGYKLDGIIGKWPHEILYGPGTEKKAARAITRAMKKKEFYSGEIINYKKNGEAYWTQVNISSIFDRDGNFDFYISVENIVTEQKEKEARLNCQYRTFREIAWTISHETRRPLASILSLITLLKEENSEAERQELHFLLEKSSLELDQIITENIKKINNQEESVNPDTSYLPA